MELLFALRLCSKDQNEVQAFLVRNEQNDFQKHKSEPEQCVHLRICSQTALQEKKKGKEYTYVLFCLHMNEKTLHLCWFKTISVKFIHDLCGNILRSDPNQQLSVWIARSLSLKQTPCCVEESFNHWNDIQFYNNLIKKVQL